MEMDVNVAKIRVGQLTQYKVWLENSRRKMCEYKSQVNNNWSGEEMIPVNLAMSQVISALDRVLSELDEVGNDIVRIANAIRTEEKQKGRKKFRRKPKRMTGVTKSGNNGNWQNHLNSLRR